MRKPPVSRLTAVHQNASVLDNPVAPQATPPKAEHIASLLGVELGKPLGPADTRRLRKPLPGYASLLLDAARQLESDGALLGVRGLSPEVLVAAHTEQRASSESEAIADRVARAAFERRMLADDAAMEMLLKLARRVQSLAEDEPALLDRWAFLIDFLGTFRSGANAKSPPAPTPPV